MIEIIINNPSHHLEKCVWQKGGGRHMDSPSNIVHLTKHMDSPSTGQTYMTSYIYGFPQQRKGRPYVQMEFCQIAFHPPQANGRFVGTIFAENHYFF